MRAPQILRFMMVGIAIGVVTIVYMNWRTRDDFPAAAESPVSGEEAVVSITEDLRYTARVNGVPRYTLTAGKRLGFRDGRSEFTGGVSLTIYGEPRVEGETPDVTSVLAERLEVTERVAVTEENRYEEIRLIDNVVAVLPDGAELTTGLLVYEDGFLSTTEGVFLRVGGMIIEAKEFRFDTATEIGDIWAPHPLTQRPELDGDVKLWGDPETGSAGTAQAPALVGYATTLRYEAGAGTLMLDGEPVVELPDATLRAIDITLALDLETNQLVGIRARGEARAEWLGAQSPGEHLLSGDLVDVELDEQAVPSTLRVSSREGGLRPRFGLGDAGRLRADEFELALGSEGAGAVVARGSPIFTPGEGSESLRRLSAGLLEIGAGGLDELGAEEDVEIIVEAAGGEATLSGPRATFSYVDGTFRSAQWPAGIRFESDDRLVEAGSGRFDAELDAWILEGAPRPKLVTGDYEVYADEVELGSTGEATLSGDVLATLRGELIAMVGPVFGGATEIAARSASLKATADGRLTFGGGAQVLQGSQLLQAEEIKLFPASNEMQASGSVLASLLDPEAETPSGEPARPVVFAGNRMLIEGSPPTLILAGGATLEGAEGRTISGDRVEVYFLEEGGWDSIEVHQNVIMVDPAGTATGDRLDYDAESGIVEVHAAPNAQASFSPNEGLEISDPEGLRLHWDEGVLRVTAMQKGTTQTVRSGGQR